MMNRAVVRLSKVTMITAPDDDALSEPAEASGTNNCSKA
jgi:hypothetical protein